MDMAVHNLKGPYEEPGSLDRDRYDESYRNRDRVKTSAVTGPVGYGAGVGAAKDLKPGKSTARVIHWRLQKTTARSTQNLSTPSSSLFSF
jgi:hypothetical protein